MPSTPENHIAPPQLPADEPAARPATVPHRRRAIRQRPLPDAQAAISALPVPDAAPPYDDAPVRRREPVTEPSSGRRAPDGPPTAGSGSRPSPQAGTWPSQFAQVLTETLAGSRPASQLAPWTTDQARERIRQLGPMLAASRQPRVRRVIVTSPVQGVLEMSVIVDVGSRSRAIAVRLERPATATDDASGAVTTRTPGAARRASAAWLCTVVEAA